MDGCRRQTLSPKESGSVHGRVNQLTTHKARLEQEVAERMVEGKVETGGAVVTNGS